VVRAEIKATASFMEEMSLRSNRVRAVLVGARVGDGQAAQGKKRDLLEVHAAKS